MLILGHGMAYDDCLTGGICCGMGVLFVDRSRCRSGYLIVMGGRTLLHAILSLTAHSFDATNVTIRYDKIIQRFRKLQISHVF